jgi:nucleotide-binding universal stress UspA family protein
MKRILVGVDGSESSTAALGWAERLAALNDAELVVANVLEPDQSELAPGTTDALQVDAERHLLTDWSAPLHASGVAWSTLVLTGDPDALLNAADHEDVDLVVVGTRHHGTVAAFHIGSLAHHLAHLTRRPLAIIPEQSARQPSDHIVIGVDGSEGSRAAARWVADMAAPAGVTVLAVYVCEHSIEWVPETDPRSWHRAAEDKLDGEWVAPLRAAGLTVETALIEDFHPVDALTTAADDAGAGLIVVGTSRVHELAGARLGRFPLQLVHHCQVPVVLVPPARTGPDATSG